jgi:uncharacterized protein YqiB (DUF1249 family)
MLVAITDRRLSLAPPRSFAGLMTLYEANWRRLQELVGDPRRLPDQCQSRADGDMALHLSVLERCPYTTVIHLTYWFPRGEALIADPDLVVRVYHDARLAEACSCSVEHHHRALTPYARRGGTELDRRWIMNVMLAKWLEFCIERRHRFAHHRGDACLVE